MWVCRWAAGRSWARAGRRCRFCTSFLRPYPNPAQRMQVGLGPKLGEGRQAMPLSDMAAEDMLLFKYQTLPLSSARRTQVGCRQKLGEGGEAVPFSRLKAPDPNLTLHGACRWAAGRSWARAGRRCPSRT